MYCNNCGKVIQDDANLCAYCGKHVRPMAAAKRLMRSRTHRKIGGVCAGFAEYLDMDITAVRLIWLIVAIMTGFGFLAYLVAWIVMPEEPILVPPPGANQQVAST